MKKFIYISTILAATAFATVSCSNEEKDLFDQSAAERTESAVTEYKEALTANGGKWVMDYFTNDEECGYTYVVTFNNDGSVTFTGKNKWIGTTVMSESSLWSVISDNGPVLTFNSYNTIFHVFSTPENFADPDWPSGHDDDIDEQGYGHKGDYEFLLMSKDENTIRLKGKKYDQTILLRRLPADTDDEAYLNSVDNMKAELFNDKFPSLVITDANGENYSMTAAPSETYNNGNRTSCGVYSIYPLDGDPVTQTVTANAIITSEGIRFSKVVEIPRADANAEPLKVQTFKYQEGGYLLCTDDNATTIKGLSFGELFNSKSYVWVWNKSMLGGTFASLYTDMVAACKAKPLRENFKSFRFTRIDNEKYGLIFKSGDYEGTIYCILTVSGDNAIKFEFDGSYDDTAKFYFKNSATKTVLESLLNAFNSSSFHLECDSYLVATRMKLVSDANSEDYIVVDVQ